jgi:predicted transcriptional regulator of viral defense system
MGYRNQKEAIGALREVASAQGGYFTARQAASAGYGYPHLVYHLKAGNFERTGHGLYRLVGYPIADHDDLTRLSLWSRDRMGQAQAIASHQTALSLHDLADLFPSETHLTVPHRFRKAAPGGVVLHRAEVGPVERVDLGGFFATTVARTLSDLSGDLSVTWEQYEQAVNAAGQRGLLKRSEARSLLAFAERARRRPGTRGA